MGKDDEAGKYQLLAEEVKKAFNEKWLDKTSGHYASRSQTAELLPLSLGLVPEAYREKLIRNIAQNITQRDQGHLRVGHAGITALIESLTANNMGNEMYDKVFSIVNSRLYPGWGYMVAQGATTVWECWGRDFAVEGGRRRSDNMTMLAGVNEFFYRYIAGIQGPNFYGAENLTPGYREFNIKPYPLKDLTYAKAHVQTVKGEISSSWELDGGTFKLKVKVPVNTVAHVSIPKLGKQNMVITENGKPVWMENDFKKGVEGVTAAENVAKYITLTVGSGNYIFQTKAQ